MCGLALFSMSCTTTGHHQSNLLLTEEVLENIRSRGASYLSDAQYNNALDVYAVAHEQYGDDVILENYLKAGNLVRNAADTAYEKKNYLQAGRIYKILLIQRITDQDSTKSLSFDETYLRKMIKVCSKCLNEIGLLKYRSDLLDEAILIWDQILSFDSDNKSAIKAIETANSQLKVIRKIRKD